MADKTETAKTVESKADKFKRLAQNRTTNALAAIAGLKGLGNRANYEYTDEQVGKIFAALESEIAKTREYYKADAKVEVEGFTL